MLLALSGLSSAAMAQQKLQVVEEFEVVQVQDKRWANGLPRDWVCVCNTAVCKPKVSHTTEVQAM